MTHLSNLVRVYTATVGAGPVTLGAAVPGFLTFIQGAVPDGATVERFEREVRSFLEATRPVLQQTVEPTSLAGNETEAPAKGGNA